MKETETKTDPRYAHVREAFSKLEAQDKAAFVLEATFDTLGHALRDVGQSVGDAIEKVGREDFFDDLFGRRRAAAPGASPAPGPAEPPTAGTRRTGTKPPPSTPEGGSTPPAA